MTNTVDRDSKYDILPNIDILVSMIESWQQTIYLMAKVIHCLGGVVMLADREKLCNG